ncbi:MAG: hypothetical protein ACREO3_07255 [Arenimonas sp.]
MNLRAWCILAAAISAPAGAASGPTGGCIRVDPVYARAAAATGGQVMRVRPDEMAKMQPFMIPQLLGDMATVERRRISLGRKGKASVDIPVDSAASSLLVSVSKTGDCAPSAQELQLVRPSGLPLADTGVGVKIAEHAMGRMFLVDAPEPGVWKLEAQGSGQTELVAQTRSELEFNRFEFVRPGGDIHGGFGKIPGSPLVGANALGAATLFGEIGSVRFRLVDDAGRTLGRPTLATNYPKADPDDYMGDVALPSVPFRVEASGVDAKGLAFKRIYPIQFEAQPVAVDAKDFSVAEVRPGMSRVVTFVVRNLGARGNFRFLATDAGGWARGPQPASATLGRNQSAEVRVPLAVPTDAQAAQDHSIVFTATREDASRVYNSAVVEVVVLRPDEPEGLR